MRFGELTRDIAERYLAGDELLMWGCPQPLLSRSAVLERAGASSDALSELCERWQAWRLEPADEDELRWVQISLDADQAWSHAWDNAEAEDRRAGRRYDFAKYAELAGAARRSVLLSGLRASRA